MSKWLLQVALLLALVALIAHAAEEASEKGPEKAEEEVAAPVVATTASPKARKPRSILQACRKELPTLCKDRKDAMRCLTSKASDVQDAVCSEWLGARTTCNKFLKENNKCAAKENARVCLRNIAKEELPASCSETDYYKSVKLFGAFRRRQTRQPKGEGKAV